MKLEEHIPNADQKLKDLILSIGDFSTEVRTGFMTRQGKTDTKNIYGEKQAQMDKWADKVLVNRLLGLDSVASVSSEERPDVVKGNPDGEFSIVMDPLDGSSLLDVNFAVGTIIGIFRNPDPFLAGKDMVAAMYILYGPLTTLTYTVGMGVHEFVLGKDETYQSNHLDISIPRGKIPESYQIHRETGRGRIQAEVQRLFLCRRSSDTLQGRCIHLPCAQGQTERKTQAFDRGNAHGIHRSKCRRTDFQRE
jgi:fructose-1,6-bisphosphatase